MTRDVKRREFFPTLVYSTQLGVGDIDNDALISAILNERTLDAAGIERSNRPEHGGWHSRDTLHKNEEFAALSRSVRDMMEHIGQDLGYHSEAHISLLAMWAIVNGPGASNRAHLHPGALWSGVYYVSAPEASGNIEFTDPRTANIMRQPRYAERPDNCYPSMVIQPHTGMLLLFPGWLYHEVSSNLTGEDRVIVSFNLG